MFFPTDVLVRKGKFGVVWIAATYASERRNILTKRDYYNVNIPKSCHDIMHPTIPFALRLSSHLLVGVSRIYLKQTKYTLEEAYQMMVKVNEVFNLARRRSLELLSHPVVRTDFITMADPIESEPLNYPLEPFREDIIQDPMAIFGGDTSFLVVNGTPEIFASPSKNSVRSSSSEMMTSPMQANKRDITMPDVLFSPNQPIKVPGEIDFGPYLEEDPFEVLEREEAARVSKSIDDIMVNDSAAREPPLADQAEDIGMQDVPMPDAPARQAASGDAPPRDARRSDRPAPDLSIRDASKQTRVGQDVGDIEIPLGDEGDQLPGDQTTKDQTPKETTWETEQVTPIRVEEPAGRAMQRPKKRRRIAIDRDIILTADRIRSNLADPTDTLRQVVIGRAPRRTAADLFSQPLFTYLANDRMAEIWHENARTFNEPFLHEHFNIHGEESELESPDRILRAGVTPSSIEIPRAAQEISAEFERSGVSALSMDSTPHIPDDNLGRPSKSLEKETGAFERRGSSFARSSQIGVDILSPIADEFGEEFAVPLDDIEEDEGLQVSGEDDLPSPKQEEFLRNLASLLSDKDAVLFSEIAIPGRTTRKVAARAFFYTLALNARQVIEVSQEETFGEITISRGQGF
eukprot:Seg2708.2 transcript_id=Seg2708.2/GoldUCD/mRNA.D3Y31 product="Sister chromatid cohesion 1 protein 3" protein_id=Seg2708.2/GoldUCD/D3Y31